MLVVNFATTALDFAAIMIMFGQVDALGGFTLPEVAFLYGTSAVAFGLSDLLLGSAERVGRRVRDGTMDVLLTRPVPVLSQLAADRFALRRLGRIVQGSLVLGWAVSRLDLEWTAGRVALLVSMLLCGTVIFGCVFVVGGAFQFSSGRRTPPRCRTPSPTAVRRCSSTRPPSSAGSWCAA